MTKNQETHPLGPAFSIEGGIADEAKHWWLEMVLIVVLVGTAVYALHSFDKAAHAWIDLQLATSYETLHP